MAFLKPGRSLHRPRPPQRESNDDSDSSPSPRPVTPVYQRRDLTAGEQKFTKSGPRNMRDTLHALLSDNRFHSVHELAALSTYQGEWFVALGQIQEMGYDFARESNSLRMRRSYSGDARQDLITLLANVNATEDEDVNPRVAHSEAKARIAYEQGVGPEPETDTEVTSEADYDGGRKSRTPGEDDDSKESFPFKDPNTKVSSPDTDNRLQISADGTVFLAARESVTATRAILAKKGSGKTYLAMVIGEEFLRFSMPLPFVAIDPTGVWYGLSSLASGKPSDKPVLILGGPNGDLPLLHTQGALACHIVTEKWPASVVIDVSDWLPEEQHEFVYEFGSQLYKVNRRPLHIFLDEADEFAPQRIDNTFPFQKKCFYVIDRLVRRGRNRGIGLTAITQRPAVLHKNILTQVDGIMVMHMLAPHDLEAVQTWMEPLMSSQEKNVCLTALPKIGVGEAFFMQGGSLVVPCVKFMTRPKYTFDSSRTPSMGDPNPPIPLLGHVDQEILDFASKFLLPKSASDEHEDAED